jgi:homoaconitase/3-isopropylmalate dehydratase large subunit
MAERRHFMRLVAATQAFAGLFAVKIGFRGQIRDPQQTYLRRDHRLPTKNWLQHPANFQKQNSTIRYTQKC